MSAAPSQTGRSWRAVVALGITLLQLWGGTALAYDLGLSGTRESAAAMAPPGTTSEFMYRIDSDEPLVTIYLLGAVARQGLYHVPAKMDLVTLLTLAGGTTTGAQVSDILIKGQGPNSPPDRQINFDLASAIRSEKSAKVALMSNDLVFVPTKIPVTTEILTGVALVSGILSIIVTGILLGQIISK